MKYIVVFALTLLSLCSISQNKMTPELLWKLGRVSGLGISKDGKNVVYSVSTPNVADNKSRRESFTVPVNGGASVQTFNPDSLLLVKKRIQWFKLHPSDSIVTFINNSLMNYTESIKKEHPFKGLNQVKL